MNVDIYVTRNEVIDILKETFHVEVLSWVHLTLKEGHTHTYASGYFNEIEVPLHFSLLIIAETVRNELFVRFPLLKSWYWGYDLVLKPDFENFELKHTFSSR